VALVDYYQRKQVSELTSLSQPDATAGKPNPELGTAGETIESPSRLDTDLLLDTLPLETIANTCLVDRSTKLSVVSPSPAPEPAVGRTGSPSPPGRDDSVPSDVEMDDASNVSQTLEEYIALESYALNRVFVHAQAAHARGVKPNEFLDKLALRGCWGRWFGLQEGVTDQEKLWDFLETQGMGSWIPSDVARPRWLSAILSPYAGRYRRWKTGSDSS
jgi:hypothetical protein